MTEIKQTIIKEHVCDYKCRYSGCNEEIKTLALSESCIEFRERMLSINIKPEVVEETIKTYMQNKIAAYSEWNK